MTDLNPEESARTVEAIFQAHAELALPAGPIPSLAAGSVYAIARQACLRLGFIEIDADCIALAWQRQSERTGHFDPLAWPSEPEDFGLAPWPRQNAFALCPRSLGLYAVLPDAQWVARMAEAGVPTLQLRLKSDDPDTIAREVKAAVKAVEGSASLLFINDHWKAALDAGAYGVHLGQEDLQILSEGDFEALRRAGLRLGLSTHGYAEMLRADRYSPSYMALGAVYPTTLKRMATAAQGTARLQRYARLIPAVSMPSGCPRSCPAASARPLWCALWWQRPIPRPAHVSSASKCATLTARRRCVPSPRFGTRNCIGCPGAGTWWLKRPP
jgi:thiamine-phosphate pyrophosphorylase